MINKPTYEELELRVEELEKKTKKLKRTMELLGESQNRYNLILMDQEMLSL